MKASKFIKRLHRAAVRGNLEVSLKQFARELASTGSPEEQDAVKTWSVNKGPTQRRADKADRKKRKGAMIAATASGMFLSASDSTSGSLMRTRQDSAN